MDGIGILSKLKNAEIWTKQSALSFLMCHYDPLGLLGPWILKGKLLWRSSCTLVDQWDDKIPAEVAYELLTLQASILSEQSGRPNRMEALKKLNLALNLIEERGVTRVELYIQITGNHFSLENLEELDRFFELARLELTTQVDPESQDSPGSELSILPPPLWTSHR